MYCSGKDSGSSSSSCCCCCCSPLKALWEEDAAAAAAAARSRRARPVPSPCPGASPGPSPCSCASAGSPIPGPNPPPILLSNPDTGSPISEEGDPGDAGELARALVRPASRSERGSGRPSQCILRRQWATFPIALQGG